MIRTNPLRTRLDAGKKCLGIWLVSNNAILAEATAQAGYDFVIIDHEHGPGDFMGAIGQQQALRSGDIQTGGPAALMRVPWNDPVYIKRALDSGIEGIMVPYIETAAEAEAAVSACKYPTEGSRGCAIGAMRATGFGHSRAEYWDRVNDEVVVIVQIETRKAVANIPEIAAVPGVDILFIGPNDLTVSSGYDPLNPPDEARTLLEEAEAAIKATGKPMAAVPYYGQSAEQMFDRGYNMLAAGSEMSLIRSAALAQLEPYRKAHG